MNQCDVTNALCPHEELSVVDVAVSLGVKERVGDYKKCLECMLYVDVGVAVG